MVGLGSNNCNTTVSWVIKNATTPSVKNGTTQISTAINSSQSVNLKLNIDTIIYAYDGSYELDNLLLAATAIVCDPLVTPPLIIGPGGTCEYQGPTINITADKLIVRSGDTVRLTWTITPTPLQLGVSCKVSGPGMPLVNQTGGGSSVSNALTSKSNFKIYCTGPFGRVEKSVTVQVVPTSQEV